MVLLKWLMMKLEIKRLQLLNEVDMDGKNSFCVSKLVLEKNVRVVAMATMAVVVNRGGNNSRGGGYGGSRGDNGYGGGRNRY